MVQSPAKIKNPLRTFMVCVALVIVTVTIYWPIRHAKFVVYDDGPYVKNNSHVISGLSWTGVTWAFTNGYEANWHPITWLSHMLDCQMFGLDAGKHHLVNLGLHSINSLLLFGLLVALTGAFWRCAIVSALFAWHPMHVESVAWIAERKDVLSTFFWLLTILAYVGYCKSSGRGNSHSQKTPTDATLWKAKWWYILTLLLFALALMSKPMVVTLPFLLLLLDFWPLQRSETWLRLVLEKLPMMLLSAASCVATLKAQTAGHAVDQALPLGVRTANGFIAYASYLGKLFWPAKLAIFYPYNVNPPAWQVFAALILLAAISVAAICSLRGRPYLFVGWCWFLGTLLPTIGLVQVGLQSMADRYTYTPAIGLFIAVVWLVEESVKNRPRFKYSAIGLGVLALLGCATTTAKQVGYWQSNDSLFKHAIDVTGDNSVAEFNLAYGLFEENKFQEAAAHYESSLRFAPNQDAAEGNLAVSLSKMGKDREALVHFQNALRLKEEEWATHLNYGRSLVAVGDTNGAQEQFKDAIRLNPASPLPYFGLGNLYFAQNRYPDAVQEYQETVRLAPNQPEVHRKLADTLNLLGQTYAAVAEYEAALRLNPDDTITLNDLAWIRAASANPSLRDGTEAVRLATHACELSQYEQPFLIGTLADAYAEAGRFEEAEETAIKARDLAAAHDLKSVAARNDELLQLYHAHQAYHEKSAN